MQHMLNVRVVPPMDGDGLQDFMISSAMPHISHEYVVIVYSVPQGLKLWVSCV